MSAVTSFNQVQLRKDWGARHRDGFGPRDLPVTLWLHHTVTAHLSANATVAQEHAQMRTLEDIGQQRFGGGISYNWILFPSGRLYQGIGVRRRGAHTIGHNTTGMAVALAGNYQNTPMTENQIRTLAWFLPFAQSQGWIRQARFNGGHRDAPGNPTACPGNAAHRQIAEIHRRVANGPGAAQSAPAQPTPASAPTNNTPVLEGTVMSASEVWSDRTPTDRVNDKNPSTMGNRVSRAHQYSWSIWQRIRDTEWGNWLAERVWMFRGIDYLNDNPTTQQGKLARAHQYAFQSRNEVRELKAMVKALAKAQDEGVTSILEAVETAERDAIRVTAAEVAKELEAETKLKVKED